MLISRLAHLDYSFPNIADTSTNWKPLHYFFFFWLAIKPKYVRHSGIHQLKSLHLNSIVLTCHQTDITNMSRILLIPAEHSEALDQSHLCLQASAFEDKSIKNLHYLQKPFVWSDLLCLAKTHLEFFSASFILKCWNFPQKKCQHFLLYPISKTTL